MHRIGCIFATQKAVQSVRSLCIPSIFKRRHWPDGYTVSNWEKRETRNRNLAVRAVYGNLLPKIISNAWKIYVHYYYALRPGVTLIFMSRHRAAVQMIDTNDKAIRAVSSILFLTLFFLIHLSRFACLN